jgi:hypothetical protein
MGRQMILTICFLWASTLALGFVGGQRGVILKQLNRTEHKTPP